MVNLRSILTLKTAELNELLAQLELTHQAISSVELTTSQIETMLKDLGLNNHPSKLIIDAEASLDSAIKSATTIYTQQLKPRRPPSSTSSHDQLDKRTSVSSRYYSLSSDNLLFIVSISITQDHLLQRFATSQIQSIF